MATLYIRADELTGETGLTVRIYPPGGAIANAGGDVLTESSGLFQATIAETLSGWHDLYIYQSGSSIYRDVVYCDGSTWYAGIHPAPLPATAVVSGAVNLEDETDEEEDVVYFYNQSPVTKVFLTDTDMSATPVDFVIEKEDKTSICEVLSITPGTTSISVSIPSIAAQTDRCFTWSLRYSATNTHIRSGPAIYRYAPIKA